MNTLHRFALIAALVALSSSATAADRPRLFGAMVPSKSAAAPMANPAAVRERLAAPDLTLIPDLAAKTSDLSDGPWFTLDLFDNLALDAQVMRVERTPGGGTAIIARLADAELGSAVLVQNGRVLTGSVTFPGGSYSILPQADGTVSIAKVAPHLLPPDGEPRMARGAAPLAGDLAAGDAPTDTGKLIDVIVFWTPAAQSAAGGLAQIQNNIDTAITLTNNAYRNGGIAQRIRLVSKQAVTYTETGPDAFGNALTAITNGTIVGTAAARNAFGADEVVLVINDPAYCGIAWLPSTISSANEDQGFAIVGGGSCLTTNFSFGHELGHNMGAHHDPYVAPGPGAFAYSHGMSKIGTTPATSWRTIMAYNNECAATVGGCTRLQYFSNPMVNYADGFAMGDGPARNNALTLNKSANAVSNYRARTVPIVASFSDVPLTDPAFGYVEFMYQGGYTGGCASGPLRFCPADPITRGQMAVFLERTKRGANFARTATGHRVHRRLRQHAVRRLHRATVRRRHHQRLRGGADVLSGREREPCGDGQVPAQGEVRRGVRAEHPRVEPVHRRPRRRPVPAVDQQAVQPRHHQRLHGHDVLPDRERHARPDGDVHLPDLPLRHAVGRLHALSSGGRPALSSAGPADRGTPGRPPGRPTARRSAGC